MAPGRGSTVACSPAAAPRPPLPPPRLPARPLFPPGNQGTRDHAAGCWCSRRPSHQGSADADTSPPPSHCHAHCPAPLGRPPGLHSRGHHPRQSPSRPAVPGRSPPASQRGTPLAASCPAAPGRAPPSDSMARPGAVSLTPDSDRLIAAPAPAQRGTPQAERLTPGRAWPSATPAQHGTPQAEPLTRGCPWPSAAAAQHAGRGAPPPAAALQAGRAGQGTWLSPRAAKECRSMG